MRKTIIHERLEKLRSINFWVELMSNPETKQFVIRLNQNTFNKQSLFANNDLQFSA